MATEEGDLLDAGDATQPGGDTQAGGDTQPGGDILDTKGEDTPQGGPAGDVLSGDDDAKPEGVPDQYTFEAPEGMTLDEAALDGFKAIAKDVGLTQSQFEAAVKFDLERSQEAQQQAVDDWNTRVDGWKSAARADKEFGGENYDANVKVAMTAIEKFADDEFKTMIRSPSTDNPEGLAIGNHPAMLRFLHRIGKALSDPDLVLGGEAQEDSVDARLKRLYPSMFT